MSSLSGFLAASVVHCNILLFHVSYSVAFLYKDPSLYKELCFAVHLLSVSVLAKFSIVGAMPKAE